MSATPILARRELFTRLWNPPTAAAVPVAQFDRQTHLLARLTYGPTSAGLGELKRLGEDAWLAAQSDSTKLDTVTLDAKLKRLPVLGMSAADLFGEYKGGGKPYEVAAQLKLAWLIRAVHNPAQLHERMVEFWSDHFNVPTATQVLSLLKVVEDRDVIRPHALGRFSDLLVASAQSPAMLKFLDNASSFAGKINENYGRELLELHTVGVDGGYTQDDVVALARLLTGWSINRSTYEFQFYARKHDGAALKIMGWSRPSGGDKMSHGVEFLRWLAAQPATAKFVCTKLARRFVADNPSGNLVGAMTKAWAAHDTAVMPVLQAMLAHSDFVDSAGQKFQRPLDFIAASLRHLGADVKPTDDRRQLRGLLEYLERFGQVPFDWAAPNGYPDVEGAWLNAGALLNRWNLIGDVLAGASALISADIAAADRFEAIVRLSSPTAQYR